MPYFQSRRAVFTLAFAATLAMPVVANEPVRTYAAISLIADGLRHVGHEASTGSLLSTNPVEVVPLGFDVLELPALRAVLGAVMASDTKGKVMPLKITDAAVYKRQAVMVSGDKASLPDDMLAPLKQAGVTHLVLVTRHRAEARMDAGTAKLGTGWVEGVGFYLDRETPIKAIGQSELTTGYIAPFVYLRVALIDMQSLKVVSTQVSTAGRVITASNRNVGADPWTILSDAEKIETLKSMIQGQIADAVSKLLASPT